jgi:hypothetical protein
MPDTDFCGYDQFVYTLNTSTQVDSATVTVHILCDSETALDGEPEFIVDSTTVEQLSLSCSTIMNDPVLKETPSGDVTFASYGNHGSCTLKDNSLIMYTPDQGFAGYDEVSFSAANRTHSITTVFFLINLSSPPSSHVVYLFGLRFDCHMSSWCPHHYRHTRCSCHRSDDVCGSTHLHYIQGYV